MTRTAIWVDAQDGDDDGDGTVSQPFRTVVRALQWWRANRATEMSAPKILLRHGEYEIDGDALELFQFGLLLAAEGMVFVNGSKLAVRPTRHHARSHA